MQFAAGEEAFAKDIHSGGMPYFQEIKLVRKSLKL